MYYKKQKSNYVNLKLMNSFIFILYSFFFNIVSIYRIKIYDIINVIINEKKEEWLKSNYTFFWFFFYDILSFLLFIYIKSYLLLFLKNIIYGVYINIIHTISTLYVICMYFF